MIETTRRGFLAGLLGTSVIAVLPIPTQQVFGAGVTPLDDPFSQILPPDGTTYQWITSAVMGQPCPENVEGFLSRGWKFVLPSAHPGAPTASAENAIATCGLILMQKPTVEQEKTRQAEREAAAEMLRVGAGGFTVGPAARRFRARRDDDAPDRETPTG